jgi:hypothetical protein
LFGGTDADAGADGGREGIRMSEQVSRKHGPVEDEAIKRQDRHDLELEGEERPDREWLGEEEAALDWAAAGRFADIPPGEYWADIELRSELARLLISTDFPVTGAALAQKLTERQASRDLSDRAAALPTDTFASLHDVVAALGLSIEHRAG